MSEPLKLKLNKGNQTMNNLLTTTKIILLSTLLAVSVAQAGDVKPKRATGNKLVKATFIKPAVCASGYFAVNKKLMNFEGKKWYAYQCIQQQNIKPKCSTDTGVIKVKNQFVGKPSDGVNSKFKVMMSYECFHYIPVK